MWAVNTANNNSALRGKGDSLGAQENPWEKHTTKRFGSKLTPRRTSCCGVPASTCVAGLLAIRELLEALGPTAMAARSIADPSAERNARHSPDAHLRRSVCRRLAGCEDTNGPEPLRIDQARRRVSGGGDLEPASAWASETGPTDSPVDSAGAGMTPRP